MKFWLGWDGGWGDEKSVWGGGAFNLGFYLGINSAPFSVSIYFYLPFLN